MRHGRVHVVFECVINISEGRDERLLDVLSRAAGASLRDLHSDPFHNRSVFTLIHARAELIHDVRSLVAEALASLDFTRHEGVHPRLGVVDVVPFIALAPHDIGAACDARDETARWIATTYDIPVFLYGPLGEAERTLPFVRAHAFSDLAPDFGPRQCDPHRGAAVVGARGVLVAWNLWLRDVSLDQARRMAAQVRRSGVRALGLQVGERVQVSCNLTDLSLATPSQVYDQVASYLESPGAIERAELVGLVPHSLLAREDPRRWRQLALSEDATIESRITRN